jgi:hypothetical protein
MVRQQGKQNPGNVFGGSWVSFDPNDSQVLRQRQNDPVAKVAIQCYQSSLLLHGPRENLRIVRPCLAGFRSTNDVMSGFAQTHRQFDAKHLIEVKAHGDLRRIEGGNFRMQNGMPGVLQSSLNIIPCQFGVAAQ